MWRRARVPCETGSCPHTDAGDPTTCHVAEAQMTQWLKIFQSAEMIFAFTGFLLDVIGPNFTFAIGELLLFVSIGFLWIDLNMLAMLISGMTTQFILNSCMCIGNIFSSTRNLAMAILSGSADVGQFLFPLAYTVGTYWPTFDYYAFLTFWGIVALLAATAGLFLLPRQPYPEPKASPTSATTPLLRNSITQPEADSLNPTSPNDISLKEASLKIQLLSWPFVLFVVIWMQLAIRLNGYLDSNEDILRQYGDNGTMGHYFGYILPMSFLPCVLVGLLTDSVGSIHATGVINLTAVIVNLLTLIPSLKLQWVTIFFFVIFKSALFSLMFSFVAENFGFTSFGTLTAVISFFGGIGNYFIGGVALKLALKFNSWFWINATYLVIGVVSQFFIWYMSRHPPSRVKIEVERRSIV